MKAITWRELERTGGNRGGYGGRGGYRGAPANLKITFDFGPARVLPAGTATATRPEQRNVNVSLEVDDDVIFILFFLIIVFISLVIYNIYKKFIFLALLKGIKCSDRSMEA